MNPNRKWAVYGKTPSSIAFKKKLWNDGEVLFTKTDSSTELPKDQPCFCYESRRLLYKEFLATKIYGKKRHELTSVRNNLDENLLTFWWDRFVMNGVPIEDEVPVYQELLNLNTIQALAVAGKLKEFRKMYLNWKKLHAHRIVGKNGAPIEYASCYSIQCRFFSAVQDVRDKVLVEKDKMKERVGLMSWKDGLLFGFRLIRYPFRLVVALFLLLINIILWVIIGPLAVIFRPDFTDLKEFFDGSPMMLINDGIKILIKL